MPSAIRKFVLLLLFWITAAPVAAAPPIVILGDSLSAGHGLAAGQGWVDLLRQRLDQAGYDYPVVNASISGDTSSGGRARIDKTLERHDPAILILELGGNDGLRGLPTEELYNNLKAIVTRARDQGARVLLVGMRIPPNYGPVYTKQFHAVYTRLAEAYNLPLVPFLLKGVDDRSLFQADQIHPTAEAQPLLLDNVWDRLAPMLKQQAAGN